MTTVAVAGGLAVGVISGKLKIPFLPGSATSPPTAPILANINFPMFGFDPQHTHLNPDEKVLSPTNVSELVRDWTFRTGGAIGSSPAIANGVVYVDPSGNNLYALDARTGSKLWAFQAASNIESSPAVANGVVYVGSHDANLYALDAHNGNKLWVFQTGIFITSSPTVANGVVYVGSEDSTLYALDARTGSKLWTFRTKSNIRSSPAIANGVVYVGSNDGNLYAFHLPG